MLGEEPAVDQRQVVGRAAVEEAAEGDPVVGGPGLGADHGDVERSEGATVGELGEEAVADHAVADHDEAQRRWGRGGVMGASNTTGRCPAVARP